MPTTASAAEVAADFDEIAALSPHGADFSDAESWVLRNLPVAREAVLEIGCGVGELCRALVPHFARPTGIDLSPGMIAEAQRRTPSIDFVVSDLFDWLPAHPESYDCIVTVTTLHHADLESALVAMSSSLRPGGHLLIIDLYERRGLRNLPANLIATAIGALRQLVAMMRRRSSLRLRLAYRRHGRRETYVRLDELHRVIDRVLPGAVLTPTLLWRYRLMWQK